LQPREKGTEQTAEASGRAIVRRLAEKKSGEAGKEVFVSISSSEGGEDKLLYRRQGEEREIEDG